MKKRIAILGGSGYVGFELARHLAPRYRVDVLDRRPPDSSVGEGLRFRHVDASDYRQVSRGVGNAHLAIHTAIIQIPKINEDKRRAYDTNVAGTQNVCRAVDRLRSPRGLLLAGSWHVYGERMLIGTIDEEFGFRPDKVEERAKLYAFSKIAQETIVRFYNEMSPKAYGVIRMGTALGERMPKGTAANIFINQALNGKPITPYAHSMHRPMLYVDIGDVCRAFEAFANKILDDITGREAKAIGVINLLWPEPITILELAETIRKAVIEHSNGELNPEIKVVDMGLPQLYAAQDKRAIAVNIEKAKRVLAIDQLRDPRETISDIVKARLTKR